MKKNVKISDSALTIFVSLQNIPFMMDAEDYLISERMFKCKYWLFFVCVTTEV